MPVENKIWNTYIELIQNKFPLIPYNLLDRKKLIGVFYYNKKEIIVHKSSYCNKTCIIISVDNFRIRVLNYSDAVPVFMSLLNSFDLFTQK